MKNKKVNAKDKLIVALDIPYKGTGGYYPDEHFKQIVKVINKLGSSVSFYKIGFYTFPLWLDLIKYLKANNKKVFLDIKLSDIPETTYQAVYLATRLNVDMITLNTNDVAVMKAAKRAVSRFEKSKRPQILNVTSLTSCAIQIKENK